MTPSIQLSVPSNAQRLAVGNDPGTLGDETTPDQTTHGRAIPKRRQDTKDRYKILMTIVNKRAQKRHQNKEAGSSMTNDKNSFSVESVIDNMFNGVEESVKRYPGDLDGTGKIIGADGVSVRMKAREGEDHEYLPGVLKNKKPVVKVDKETGKKNHHAGDVIAHLAAAAAVHHAHNIMQAKSFEERDKVGAPPAVTNNFWFKHRQAIPHLYHALAKHHGIEVPKHVEELRDSPTINHTTDTPSSSTIKSVANVTKSAIELAKLASTPNKKGEYHAGSPIHKGIADALKNYDPHDHASVAKLLAAHHAEYEHDKADDVPNHVAVKEALGKLTRKVKGETRYPGAKEAAKSIKVDKTKLTKIHKIVDPTSVVDARTGEPVKETRTKKENHTPKNEPNWFAKDAKGEHHHLDQEVDLSPGKGWLKNPAWDPKHPHKTHYAKRVGSDQDKERNAYTDKHNDMAQNEKFDIVARHAKHWPEITRKMEQDSKKETPEGMHAFIAHVINHTKGRIGSGNNTRNESYGISTAQVRHFNDKGKVPKLSYAGKKGHQQEHEFNMENPAERAIVERLRKFTLNANGEKKGDDEDLFTHHGKDAKGNHVVTKAKHEDVNKYLKKVTGDDDFHAHKIRSLYGTMHMHNHLNFGDKAPEPGKATEDEVHSHYQSVLGHVARMLHHGSKDKPEVKTTLNNYIDPRVIHSYFERHGVKTPSDVTKLIEKRKPGKLPKGHGYQGVKESLNPEQLVDTGDPFLNLHNEYVRMGIIDDDGSMVHESAAESLVSWWYGQ